MLLFVLVAVSTVWMHVAIRRGEARRYPQLAAETDLSDLPDQPYPAPAGAGATAKAAARSRPALAD